MTDEERMRKFRQFFPEDDKYYGKDIIDTAEVIDGEYLSGTFDFFLTDGGYNPTDIGVSAEAVMKRADEMLAKAAEAAPKSVEETIEKTTEMTLTADTGEIAEIVGGMMEQLMRPLLESIGTLLKNNTEAMAQIAASQDVIRNRMEALEKQVRLNTPVTDTQARFLQTAARDKARELLAEKRVEDRRAVNRLAGIIRKQVMARYGVGSLREIPRCEYSVAMGQVERWMSVIQVQAIVNEARAREEALENDA